MFRKEIVERRLLHFSILTFCLEVLLFLGLSDLLPIRLWNRTSKSEQSSIGEVEVARQNVRRRGFDSNIWEDSTVRDHLFANDSILTLSGSTAKLKLKGDVKIELHENTLVVLESEPDEEQKPFRLRFNRGDLRSLGPKRGVQLKSGEWTITAAQGSDLSLRAVDSGRVEVEVNAGQASIHHAQQGVAREMKSNQRLLLYPEDASNVVTMSEDLQWDLTRSQKIYAHEFPVHAAFSWQGTADTLQMLSPSQGAKAWPLNPQQNSTSMELYPGSYHLTLAFKENISKTLSVQVLKAPKITHLSPLPRDRVKTDFKVPFAWLSELEQVGRYQLEFARDESFLSVIQSEKTLDRRISVPVQNEGLQFWRVQAFDEDEFPIPPAFSYPLYGHPDPLDAPKIRAPSAIDNEDSDVRWTPSRNWKWALIWSFLFPQAEGKTKPKPLPPVIFNWDPVTGADYYIIEISTSAQFESPEVIAKVSSAFYAWTNFNKQIYYYRVAAGTEGGRVGVFSPPELIDLQIWPKPKVKRTSTATADASPQAPIQRPAPPPPPSPLPLLPPVRTEKESVGDKDSKIVRAFALWWQPSYQNEQQKNKKEDLNIQLKGATHKGLGSELVLDAGSQDLYLQAQVSQTRWRPQSKKDFPFQSPLDSTTSALMVALKSKDSPWLFGAKLAGLVHFKRVASEKVTHENVGAFGPSLGYRFLLSPEWEQKLQASWLLSGRFQQIEAEGTWLFLMAQGWKFGFQTSLGTSFGQDSVTSFQSALQLGFGF